MLFPNGGGLHRELVLALVGFRCFRVKHLVSVFGLLDLLQRQVSTLRINSHLLEQVGVGQRNPDAHALAVADILHRECIVKNEMALVLSESRQRREYEKQKEQRSTQHDESFEGGW